MRAVRLATRRSPLALAQAQYVASRLAAIGVETELVHVETHGDRHHDVPIDRLGGQGAFAVEVQRAVLDGEADVCVHSAKDLPSTAPDGLRLVCVPERRDPSDALIGRSLAGLGPGATVATGSPRRRALLLERRPDLRVVGLRGNMATRFGTVGRDGVDAVVVATAALERLSRSDLSVERLDPEWFVPQVGQGAIALETRGDDGPTTELMERLNDASAMTALLAERAFLRELGSGCTIPAGAHATVVEGLVRLSGVMLALDGSRSVRVTLEGTDPRSVGARVARRLRDDEGGATLPGWVG